MNTLLTLHALSCSFLFNAGDVKSGAGKTPNVDAIAGGPAFLGYTGIMVSPRQDDATDQGEGNADDLHYFIAKYVVATRGPQKIKKCINEDKRLTVWDLFTVDDVVYPIAVLKNKMAKWVRDIKIKDMEEDEQEKYANYESIKLKTTLTPEGRGS